MNFDVNTITEDPRTKRGLSLNFIAAGILLLFSNLGIDISFAHLSIHNILPHDYMTGVKIYIIIALFSLVYTIFKQNLFKDKPYIARDNSTIACHNCNNSMEVSERKCNGCGSIFIYKNKDIK